ncbi:MAG: zinc-dependent alcohol dehydrogenase family protein [Longimicrobiales bacterium]
MLAMVLEQPRSPLRATTVPRPRPGPDEILLQVHACAVCRTDLHIVDGELTEPKLPLIPGHQIVGTVVETGAGVQGDRIGARVGVPWLGWTDGRCSYCLAGHENLCDRARFTGYQIDGGYAEFAVADHRFCFPIPQAFTDLEAAPLLCAGIIGYRALRMVGEAQNVGFYGFGSAAHLLTQVARHRGQRVFAFTRSGDTETQAFARELRAVWAGSSETTPPEPLDAAIIFAPAGALVPVALRAVRKGGVVVCAGIHMSDLPAMPYELLWEERVLRSVANLTRDDGREFLAVAPQVPVRTEVRSYPLAEANSALDDVRRGALRGTAVLVVHDVGGRVAGRA